MPQFTILNDRRFWLFFAFLVSQFGYPIGAFNDWWTQTGVFGNNNHPGGGDFINFWIASRAALEGHASALFDPQSYSTLLTDQFGTDYGYRWLYPPHFLLLILPLGLFPYGLAFALFMGATLLLYLAIARRLWGGWGIVGWLLIAPVTALGLLNGQTCFLIGALFIGGVYLWDERPILAGIFLGLLTVKPQFGVLIPFVLLIERRWWVIGTAMATATCLIGASVIAFGVEPWREFFISPLSASNDVLLADRTDLMGIHLAPFGAARFLGFSPATASIVQLGFSLFAVGALSATHRLQARPDTKVAMLIAATYLFIPYVLFYDLAAPTFAALSLYFGRQQQNAPGVAFSILLVGVGTLSFINGATTLIGIPLGPAVFAILCAALIRRAYQEGCEAAQPLPRAPVPRGRAIA
ncbi:glycosyltransferase family 87 protein [Afifella aestuarii]|uniref:glycosyltransferase family 87 protein n=1 Tax=Afifella aestuarii TaxID=1909496 RepID=UPI000FE3B843|nr:glycosyltransferase family 87 protein [Afifella aestuarii]